jgi:AraC family transcriptional regulator of adaptative response / DNA-3-methyladenine glycosylase II
VITATVVPAGPYSLRLTARSAAWQARLPGGRSASAVQVDDGRVVIRASDEAAVEQARFLLALDEDTSEFHRRFSADPLLGPSTRALRGLRPLRKATVAHAALRAVAGQLVQAGKARAIERAVIRACGVDPPTQHALASLSAAELVSCGLAASRAATLARLVRELDLESLREQETSVALARLARVRGVGPWSVGVIALRGLGRYDVGLVGDLGLVKLLAALRGRWPEPGETAVLLEPYGEWQGLASVFLLAGLKRRLVPGADLDRARSVRAGSAGRAAPESM